MSTAYAIIQHTETAGTDGGTATVGVSKRRLNTVAYDGIGVTLTNDEITLPAGLYRVSGYGCANIILGSHRIALAEVTGAFTYHGSSGQSQDLGAVTVALNNPRSTLTTPPFFCAAPTTVRLDQYAAVSTQSSDLGLATNDSETEVYAELVIERLDCCTCPE